MKLKNISKGEQERFKDKLRKFFENPLQIIPQQLDDSFFCPFSAYRNKLEKMAQKNDFTYKGSDTFLSGIYETWKLIDSEIPILGLVKTPYGTSQYGRRGNTDERILAGIQNYDHDVWRMLAFSSIVKSKDIAVYSTRNFYLASCKQTPPGMDFFVDLFEEEGLKPVVNGNILDLGNGKDFLDVSYFSGLTFRVHDDVKTNIIYLLLKHIMVNRIEKYFDVSFPFLSSCVNDIPPDVKASYFETRIDNRQAIEKVKEFRKREIVRRGIYAIGSECFSSIDDFLRKFPDIEEIVNIAHEYSGGIYLETASSRKLIDILWNENGDKISEKIIGSHVEKFEDIDRIRKEIDADRKISIDPWSDNGMFLITMIRDYFKNGREQTVMRYKESASSHIKKAILFAFVTATGKNNIDYIFSNEDKNLGKEIVYDIKNIIDDNDVEESLKHLRKFVP